MLAAVMPRIKLVIPILAIILPSAVAGQGAIDFSGTWKMDVTRSESAHQAVPIGPVTLIIKQTATEVSMQTRHAEAKKSAAHNEILTYRLDGSESTVTLADGSPIKCRAHWEGTKLVTGTTRNIQGATITTLYAHSLDATGNELSIHKTLTVQHGYQFEGAKSYGTGTDVFVRTKVATAK